MPPRSLRPRASFAVLAAVCALLAHARAAHAQDAPLLPPPPPPAPVPAAPQEFEPAPALPAPPSPRVAVEISVGGNVFGRAVGGYTFSGGGVSGTGRDLGLDRAVFAGGTARVGLLIERSFAIGAVGFLHGLAAADPNMARGGLVMAPSLFGGGGGLEIGSVLPLGRLSLRSSVVGGVFTMGMPTVGSAHTCTRRTRSGMSYSTTCYDSATMFAPFLQARLAGDYEVVDDLSIGLEGTFDVVPWFGWSVGLYVRLHPSGRRTPPRRRG